MPRRSERRKTGLTGANGRVPPDRGGVRADAGPRERAAGTPGASGGSRRRP